MPTTIGSWLQGLSPSELVDLALELARDVEGVRDWLVLRQLAESRDAVGLRAEVDGLLTPHSGSYSYGEANAYARDAQGVVDLLRETAESPTVAILPVIERAIGLVTRTVLRADDSSGALGDLVATLLDAHALAVRRLGSELTAKERRRIADWIVKFRYGGRQDFFDPDIVAYAPGLGDDGIARYREAIGQQELGRYGRYPLQRLAVLDRDAAAIVDAHGGEPENALIAVRIVEDLTEAGLHSAALRYAEIGLALPAADRASALADLVVQHRLDSGDVDAALHLRRQRLAEHPGWGPFASHRDTATRLGRWDAERPDAERVLRDRVPWQFVSYLLGEERDDDAWQFAMAHPEAAASAGRWPELCARRAKTHPADTLPVYRGLITSTLEVADKRNYRAAANLLVALRAASDAAGEEEAFEVFLATTVEANRRRPTCIEIFRRSGLA